MRLIDADTLGDITITINGTVFVRYEDIMNEPIIEPINEADLKELRDRFGECVEYVVRDMLSGQDERWDEQDIAEADKAYAEYKANPKTYTLVEPERGRWVPHDCSGRPSIDKDVCSVCGNRFTYIAETGCTWNFCPNCGAKMYDPCEDCQEFSCDYCLNRRARMEGEE